MAKAKPMAKASASGSRATRGRVAKPAAGRAGPLSRGSGQPVPSWGGMASRYAYRNATHAASLATRNAAHAAVLRKHANNMRVVTGNHNATRAKLAELEARLEKAQKEFRQVKRGGRSSHIHKARGNEIPRKGWFATTIDGVKYVIERSSNIGTIVLAVGAMALIGVGAIVAYKSGATFQTARANLRASGQADAALQFAQTVVPGTPYHGFLHQEKFVGNAMSRLLAEEDRKAARKAASKKVARK